MDGCKLLLLLFVYYLKFLADLISLKILARRKIRTTLATGAAKMKIGGGGGTDSNLNFLYARILKQQHFLLTCPYVFVSCEIH